jgi:putative membrane protein insertion efficiency factor
MIRNVALGLLRVYRWTRPYQHIVIPPTCRFYPSCSAYAEEAISQHGLILGSWHSLCRLLRCHPGHPGGVDLVPPSSTAKLNQI